MSHSVPSLASVARSKMTPARGTLGVGSRLPAAAGRSLTSVRTEVAATQFTEGSDGFDGV